MSLEVSHIFSLVPDNGQVWAIIGCVLTIVNIIAALVFYLYKKRSEKKEFFCNFKSTMSEYELSTFILLTKPLKIHILTTCIYKREISISLNYQFNLGKL